MSDLKQNYNSKGEYIGKYKVKNDREPPRYTFSNGKAYKMNKSMSKTYLNKNVQNLVRNDFRNCERIMKGEHEDAEVIDHLYLSSNDILSNGYTKIGDEVFDFNYIDKISNLDSKGVDFETDVSEILKNYHLIKNRTNSIEDKNLKLIACSLDRCYVGRVIRKSYGCLLADVLLYLSTVCIFSLLLVKFFLAVMYTLYNKKLRKIIIRNETGT